MSEKLESSIEVRPNCVIEVTYTHLGPDAAPPTGEEWAAEVDHPRVDVQVRLPTGDHGRAAYLQGAVIPEAFASAHGNMYVNTYRLMATRRAPTVREAYDQCRQLVEELTMNLQACIDARNARLQQRSDTITASRVGSPFHHVD